MPERNQKVTQSTGWWFLQAGSLSDVFLKVLTEG